MYSTLSKIVKEADTLINETICHKCNYAKPEFKLLHDCDHVMCISCFSCETQACLKCNTVTCKRDTLPDDVFKEIHVRVGNLRDINYEKFGNTQIETVFVPEVVVNKRDHKGETPLHKYCRNGDVEKAVAVIETGVDVNVQDFAGWTPLHEAVMSNKIEIVNILLKNGALPNVPGLNYDTPLHAAVLKENYAIYSLLSYGANILSYNRDGKTPMDFCSGHCFKTLCLEPRNPILYKVYTIPCPNVFSINVDDADFQKLSDIPGFSRASKRDFFGTGGVNYVVIGDSIPNIQYVQAAMLQGACVVTKHWMNEYVAKEGAIYPLNFLADIPGYNIRKAALNKFERLPKLFDGLQFYFCNKATHVIDGQKYTHDNFKTLINLGGGKIMKRRPIAVNDCDVYFPYHAEKDSNLARVTCYILYDAKDVLPQGNTLDHVKYKSTSWLIDCINSFRIIA